MPRTLLFLSLAISGCSGGYPSLIGTEPIDPVSLVLTVRADGAVVEGERRFTRDSLRERVGTSGDARNMRPILLEVPPEAAMRCVNDAMIWLCQANCVNVGFRVRTGEGDRAVRLPIVLNGTPDRILSVYDGLEEIVLVDNQHVIELVTRVGIRGAIDVTRVQYTREYVYFPEKGEVVPEKDGCAWYGVHPPCGIWSVETLRSFIRRPDLARHKPYVGLNISWDDRVQDVILCLSALREAAGSRVEPILKPE